MAHRDMTNGSVGMSGLKYDAFVSRQRNYHDTDWAAKLQEKYWGARQKFLAKVERKEDSCIVLSDSKLDAKLEVSNMFIEKTHSLLAANNINRKNINTQIRNSRSIVQ